MYVIYIILEIRINDVNPFQGLLNGPLICLHKYTLFSYNKNINFPPIKIGKNKINESCVTKFLGIHLDKK